MSQQEEPNDLGQTEPGDDTASDSSFADSSSAIPVDQCWALAIADLCKNTNQAKIEEIKQKIESTPFKYDYSNLQEELNKVKDAPPKDE
jgi:anti-sigma28 factor (negative regulator of flagellin synthesis)